MRNFFIFCICIFASISVACKKQVEKNSSGKQEESRSFVHIGSSFDKYDHDSLKVLLYEDNGSLQQITKEELTNRTFRTGAKIKIGVVLYKKGVEVFKTDDTKGDECRFEEKTLEKGDITFSVNVCKVDLKDQDGKLLVCNDSKEVYSSCKYLEKIEANNSFYSPAISQMSCSDYSEIICYYEEQGKKPVVYLVCATEKDMKDGDGWFCLPQENNKIQFGLQKYEAIKIGESHVL